MVNALEKPQNLSANRIISIPLASYMSRNIKHMSGWARNLMIKVRNELSNGISSNIIGTRLGYTQPLKGNNWELDQYYKDILDDKERRIIDEEDYRRLMGSGVHNQVATKYTGPLSCEEIEAIEDITKEKE